jgi:hypothetical protein
MNPNLNKEKIKRMIVSAIKEQNLEAIEKIAEGEDAMAIAAQYILNPKADGFYSSEYEEVLAKIREGALDLSEYATFNDPIYEFPDPQNKEAWDKLACIGKWDNWEDIYYVVSRSRSPSCEGATEQRSVVAWAWCWTSYSNRDALKAAIEGRLCQFLNHCPNSGAGWAIAKGLLLAIDWGWVVPENKEEFILDYCRWTSYSRWDVIGDPLSALGLNREDLSEELLQALACFWDVGAIELGKRHVKLMMPLVQSKFRWVQGVEYSVPERSFDEDVDIFLNGSVVEKHVLFDRYCHFGGKSPIVQNPEDPFGEKVRLFALKVGTLEYPPSPTYEEAIAYVDRCSQ